MIVISGALVLVALILLVIGLIGQDLIWVYLSIGVSLGAFAFLVIGILQRRKEEMPGSGDAPVEDLAAAPEGMRPVDPSEGVKTVPASAARTTVMATPPTASASSGSGEGKVLVVAGRPRYHVEGCRYLTGKDAESVDAADAREEGFTACGVCKPDESLAASASEAQVDEPAAEELATMETASDSVDSVDEVEVDERAPIAPARTSLAKPPSKTATTSAATARAAKAAPTTRITKPATKSATAPAAKASAAKSAPAGKAAAAKAPAKVASKATSKAAPVKSSPAKKAAAVPTKRGGVIVIPDRGKFHTSECRYVRGAEGTLELTRAAAVKQGYDACGVCSP